MRLFASHDWGVGGSNHKRVKEVVRLLRDMGHKVWFDESEMKGNLMDDMCTGIDDSDAVLVFVTRTYMQKVASGIDTDNCRREFMYSQRRHGTSRMITIRFDPALPGKWWGPVGMLLGERFYVDLSSDDKYIDNMAELSRILPTTGAPRNVVGSTFVAAKNAIVAKKQLSKATLTSAPKEKAPVHKDSPFKTRHGECTIACTAVNTRDRVNRLMQIAGMSEHSGEHTHEKLDRLFASIGLDDDKSIPFHVKVRQAERELGMCC